MEERFWPHPRSSSGLMKSVCLLLVACSMLPISSALWASDWLKSVAQIPLGSSSTLDEAILDVQNTRPTGDDDFSLRHIFHPGTRENPMMPERVDIYPGDMTWARGVDGNMMTRIDTLRAKSMSMSIDRLSDRSVPTLQAMYRTARLTGIASILPQTAWVLEEVSGPNTTDKETVVNLAKMAWNAYTKEPRTGEWQDETGHYNYSQGFGWEGDSLRGHIFANKRNTTVIIALKGTSPAVFDGAETTTNDKVNDNLFFGCCCGQGGHYLWHPVCDCMTSAYTCNSTCLVKAIREENRYYAASIELYGNVTELYPDSQVWLVGHSLGGSTSALLGLTFGLPVTTFEAPGDALAAVRLGLPSPPNAHPSAPQTRKNTGAVHFGHTADPIFMGTCNAATSGCTLGGYSMQTECHTGTVCRYDTVGDKGWRVGIGYHRIRNVIEDVLEVYDELPPCVPDEECVDCFNWKYFESNGSDTTTTSTSTSSTAIPTRTTTCKTPGWWGCLDESTTTTTCTTSTSTSTTPSTSCVKYGWFGGCVETTTVTKITTSPSGVPSTSCVKHDWLGGCSSTAMLSASPAMGDHTQGPTVTTTRPVTSMQDPVGPLTTTIEAR